MNRQHYLFISSDDTPDLFPDNKPEDFRVELTPFIHFTQHEEWSIAVTEMEVYPTPSDPFTICLDACNSSQFGHTQVEVLRKFYPLKKGKRNLYTFQYPYYMRINRNVLDVLHFYIIDEQGSRKSFEIKTLKLTLHLRASTPWFQS